MRSPFPRRLAGAALALGLTASLAACTGSDPEPTALPSKSEAAPVFASDEEAFAAAEEAYARFRDVLTEVTHDGGHGTERLQTVAIGEGLEQAEAAAKSYLDAEEHTAGSVKSEVRVRVQYFETPDRGAVIQVNVCEDIRDLDVLNAAGESVVQGTRTELMPQEVIIEGKSAEELKVSSRWTRGKFCL